MYKAFISYSHAGDGKLAPALQVALEQFAKPWYKLRNLNVFRDESSLSASPHLWDNIKKALDNSEYLVYMASPESAKSKWVLKEIEYWLEHKSSDKILIAITDGEIVWDKQNKIDKGLEKNPLPEVLLRTFKDEPFYVDLRASKTLVDVSLKNPIFKKEVLKLAAHLHGKAPKDLAGDEVKAHSKMMRIRNGVITILVLLLFFSIYQTFEAKSALNQAEMELQDSRLSKVVQIESELRAANAEGKIKLIDLLIKKGISADVAIRIIKYLENREGFDFMQLESIEIDTSKSAPDLYKIKILDWNNKIVSEVDSLNISFEKE